MNAQDPFRRLERIERVARGMDRAFRLPLTRIRLGWDSIIGLIPGVGDTLALAPALWIVHESRQIGAPKPLVAQMLGNIGVDWVIGLLPLLRDVLPGSIEIVPIYNKASGIIAFQRRSSTHCAWQRKTQQSVAAPAPLSKLQCSQK